MDKTERIARLLAAEIGGEGWGDVADTKEAADDIAWGIGIGAVVWSKPGLLAIAAKIVALEGDA